MAPDGRIGVAVLPIRQVPVHNRPELRIIWPALVQPVEQGCELAYCHREQAAARLQHPPGLAQGLPPVRAVRRVVQRPEQQHRVLRLVRLG